MSKKYLSALIFISGLLVALRTSAVKAADTAMTISPPYNTNTKNILGVASNYNVFAAGKLTISGEQIRTFEGRYAANEIEDTDGAWNTGFRWGNITSTGDSADITPMFTANKINYTPGTNTNMLHDLYDAAGDGSLLFNAKNKVVVNTKYFAKSTGNS